MSIFNPSEGFAIEPGPGGAGGPGGGVAVSAAGASASSGTVVFSNSNNVSFGMAGSTVTATATFVGGAQSVAASAANGSVAFSTLSFSNINGVSFITAAGPAIQASVVTTYLTSQSNQAASASNGSFTFQTVAFSNANNVTFGTSAGSIVTASVAAQSVQPVAASASNGSFLFSTVAFSNANNVTFGTSAGSIVTASVAAQTNQTGISSIAASNTTYTSGGVTFTGSNIVTVRSTTGQGIVIDASTSQSNQQMTMFATSNTTQSSSGTSNASSLIFVGAGQASVGITNGSIVISVPAGTNTASTFKGGISNLGATSGTSGLADQQMVLVGTSGITLSQSLDAGSHSGTITIIGGGVTLSTYEPYPAFGFSTAFQSLNNTTSGVVSVWPFVIDEYVSAGAMNLMGSMSFVTNGTSSGRQTAGLHVGLYTRGAGANSTTIGSLRTTSIEWSVTGNNSTYSINQLTATSFSGYGATAQTSSAGVNISSGYTGIKLMAIPVNSLLTPGPYWLAVLATNSTSSVNVGISFSLIGAVLNTQQTAMAPMGSFSTAYSLGNDPLGGRWAVGLGNWSSAGSVTGLPNSMAFTSISASNNVSGAPLVKFWST